MNNKHFLNLRLFPLLLTFLCFSKLTAQKTPNDFTQHWKQIEELIGKGLTKSALSEVQKIYISSKKSSNEPQIIKSLLYKLTLQQNITEDASVKSIDTLEREIISSAEPAKSILESITAQMYLNYFQQNRYKLYQRTNTVNFSKDDIATWATDDLHRKIGTLFLASLKDKTILQKTSLKPFDAIIINGNVRYLRPTLYDLLAHRALDYFKTDERDITRPAYAFEIKDKEALAGASEFINYKFISRDSSSLHKKALFIFQDILAFHLQDANPDAFIDADIERINFVHQYGVMSNKDTLYMQALKNISLQFKNNPATAQATFLAAQMIYNSAIQSSKNKNTVPVYTVRQAKEMLEAIAKKFPGSEGGINAENLLIRILQPEINLTTEKVNVPGMPFRTLVTYKNFNSVYFRILTLTPQLKKQIIFNTNNDQIFQKLTNEKSYRSWKQSLPPTRDYLSHSTEVKIDALPVGEYVLLGSASPGFVLNKNPIAAQYFFVSNISFINSGQQYFVLDRTSGQPLEGANVQVYTQNYNYNTRSNQLDKKALLITDKNGYFKLPASKKNESSSIRLEIAYKNDRLFLDDPQYMYTNYYNNTNEVDYEDQKGFDEDNARVFLFTDRSIYRPGQLVYFKGIGVTKDWKSKKSILLQSKDTLTLYLSDANGQNIDSLKVLLNEFGSFNGKFTLPKNKLNGNFKIDIKEYKNSSINFSVEEYKRPEFYTEFEKIKSTYRVGDTVSITGFAKAYAGNNIDGARVTYRVTRVARFLYSWRFWRSGFPHSATLEITNGEIVTDPDGKFTIKFAAIPDLSIDKNTDPVFDYKVEADVTDINGETRSTDITVPIGYQSLNLQIILPQGDIVHIDSLNTFSIISRNLSNEPQTVKAEVKIYKLQPPERLIRKRLWETPDQFMMTKNEFIKYFPHDEYNNELEKETWPKSALAFNKTDSTNSADNWKLTRGKFQQGWYVIEATAKDKYGQGVKDVKYFQVYDKNSLSLPAPSYVWNYIEKNSLEPGETAHLITGTAAQDLFLIQQVNKPQSDGLRLTGNKHQSDDGHQAANQTQSDGDRQADYSFFSLNNNKKIFDFKISEDDRGGFGVNQFFVKDNRFYVAFNTVYVPWNNKELNISFDTYRDKTLPGSEEKWKVKIRGYKGEKVAAEMLASMYDASLDQFKPHSWSPLDLWPTFNGYNTWTANQNFTFVQSFEKYWNEKYIEQKEKKYDELNYLPNNFNNGDNFRIRGISSVAQAAPGLYSEIDGNRIANLNNDVTVGYGISKNAAPPIYDSLGNNIGLTIKNPGTPIDQYQSPIQIRKNFNETAFFFPELRTDKEGDITFSFTMPEAVTQWKLMTLAHTKGLASGYAEKTVITQKNLMVQPNAPRFLREGDTMLFTAKIVNLGDKEVTGQAAFHLLNASTMNPVDGWFKNISPSKTFKIAAGQSALVTFNIEIPINFNNAVVYRIVAKADHVSDGEEAVIPVITNRTLVTESMPLPMRGDGTRDFKFTKLINSGKSETLTNYGLTVEYTTNPAWYAIQALPYLMEFPYECAEQTFNRYYANSIATKIINSSPKIKAVFEKWKITDTAAMLSNLQKNEELKSILLQETPWVLQAQNEEQQKKNIALLFDMNRMSTQMKSALNTLTDMQSPNGGFVWFKGGPDDRYITQYIITGIGHLKKLKALSPFQDDKIKAILNKAIPYLDKMLKKDYDELGKSKTEMESNHLSSIAIQYLYMRSFFPEYAIAPETLKAYNYYREQSKKYWLGQSKYMQALIALELYRTNDKTTALSIIQSLKENSIDSEESGMYWKEWNHGGYWWYQAPIESQALMIEAFSEIGKDQKIVDDLKTWLLKNKQTTNWKTTIATAEACYALLLQGTDWLSEEKTVTIKSGNTTFNNKDEKLEAGTGYFKRRIDGDKVKPEMGNIRVTVSTNSPFSGKGSKEASWGSVYWQYFENLDKITFSETPLKLNKKLFIEKNSERGPVLFPVTIGTQLHIGDKIKVRIELRADRDMEYVHMKDMRASCIEPTNVISEYKYQDGLGYYETTRDASTDFFFGYLNKGSYIFEYPMFVTHAGNFSNGITTIQCMYAPEFTAHSEGERVNVIK